MSSDTATPATTATAAPPSNPVSSPINTCTDHVLVISPPSSAAERLAQLEQEVLRHQRTERLLRQKIDRHAAREAHHAAREADAQRGLELVWAWASRSQHHSGFLATWYADLERWEINLRHREMLNLTRRDTIEEIRADLDEFRVELREWEASLRLQQADFAGMVADWYAGVELAMHSEIDVLELDIGGSTRSGDE